MATITVNEKYKIEIDQYNFTVIEIIHYKSKDDEDKEREKVRGYYPTLQNALVALSHLMTASERENYSLDEYITRSIKSSKTVRNNLKLKIKDLEEK